MKNGRKSDVVDYLKKFDWNINNSKQFRQTTREYQASQRDGSHMVLCAWRSSDRDEIEAAFRKVHKVWNCVSSCT